MLWTALMSYARRQKIRNYVRACGKHDSPAVSRELEIVQLCFSPPPPPPQGTTPAVQGFAGFSSGACCEPCYAAASLADCWLIAEKLSYER